jgi:hypothetical protein
LALNATARRATLQIRLLGGLQQGVTFQRYLRMTPTAVLTAEARSDRDAIATWLRAHHQRSAADRQRRTGHGAIRVARPIVPYCSTCAVYQEARAKDETFTMISHIDPSEPAQIRGRG